MSVWTMDVSVWIRDGFRVNQQFLCGSGMILCGHGIDHADC